MKRILLLLLTIYSVCTSQAAVYSGTLPVLYIQTENNATIVSKDYYLNATYYVDALGLTGYENLGSASAPLTMEIKGRGNYTWKDFNGLELEEAHHAYILLAKLSHMTVPKCKGVWEVSSGL